MSQRGRHPGAPASLPCIRSPSTMITGIEELMGPTLGGQHWLATGCLRRPPRVTLAELGASPTIY